MLDGIFYICPRVNSQGHLKTLTDQTLKIMPLVVLDLPYNISKNKIIPPINSLTISILAHRLFFLVFLCSLSRRASRTSDGHPGNFNRPHISRSRTRGNDFYPLKPKPNLFFRLFPVEWCIYEVCATISPGARSSGGRGEAQPGLAEARPGEQALRCCHIGTRPRRHQYAHLDRIAMSNKSCRW